MNRLYDNKIFRYIFDNKIMYIVFTVIISIILPWVIFKASPINSGNSDIESLSYFVSIIILVIIFSLNKYYKIYLKNANK